MMAITTRLQDTSNCLRSTSLQNLNALIAIVELKRLFQESLSLEDFHTKALRLVKEAKYPEGAIWNRVL